jgi:SAM-dependent methyltransferase
MTETINRAQAAGPDWNSFVHEQIRTVGLSRLPAGARVVLSGGAAGSWYFDWFNSNYPTPVERHIAVEAFSPKPPDLPPEVEWLPRTLGDLAPVADGEVDLVYAGEVIEHLWPEDVAGFLLEAHRVLRDGGVISLDSPNRRVTTALDWLHPEHTVEFTPDEIKALLDASGFDEIEVHGAWLTFDEQAGEYLPLAALDENGSWPWRRRLEEAANRPDESFIWWAQAKKGRRSPDTERVHELVWRAYSVYRSFRFSRLRHHVGRLERVGDGVAVRAGSGEAGYLLTGPTAPMPPGSGIARFFVSASGDAGPEEAVLFLDIVSDGGDTTHAERSVTLGELPADDRIAAVDLPFEFEKTTFGVEFRVASAASPGVAVAALLAVELAPQAVSAATRVESSSEPQRAEAAPPPTDASRSIIRRIGRVVLWPLIRFFNPRFIGLSTQMTTHAATLEGRLDWVTTQLEERLQALQEEAAAAALQTESLVRDDMDTHTESFIVLGQTLAELRSGGEVTASKLDELAARLPEDIMRRRPAIPPQVPWSEEYVRHHRQFIADVLDDPELIARFRSDEALPRGYGIGLEERVVEYPWTFAQDLCGRGLDAGSSLNFQHVLDRFQPRFDELHLFTLAPEFESFPERGISYVYGDARALPYRDGQFDTIVCISTLDHVGMDNGEYGSSAARDDDPQAETRKMMVELRRVVAPGGSILFTVPYGRRVDLVWSRQFGEAEIRDLIDAAAPRDQQIAVYRYEPTGWTVSSLEASADAEYHDYKSQPGPTDDMAAAARAVACVRLSF